MRYAGSNKPDPDHWIEEIQARGRHLTEWEETFVESVKAQLDRTGSLSDKQLDWLERIYIYADQTP